ncbi:hypothetical protein BJX64DRAFT_169838 [Aspergillus heterothallicus]
MTTVSSVSARCIPSATTVLLLLRASRVGTGGRVLPRVVCQAGCVRDRGGEHLLANRIRDSFIRVCISSIFAIYAIHAHARINACLCPPERLTV